MSMRNYGIYQQGAIFYPEDFDPAKVIMTVCVKIMEVTVPDNIQTALAERNFNPAIVAEICELLGIPKNMRDNYKCYADISNSCVADAEAEEWFSGREPLMGTSEAEVMIFSDIEGDYVFDAEFKGSQYADDCFMFSVPFPCAWQIADFQGAKDRESILANIRVAAQPLLKDDIDWSDRLGILIGSTFG